MFFYSPYYITIKDITLYCIIFGAGRHRSPYLSHAKQALYHLSYSPPISRLLESNQRPVDTPNYTITVQRSAN